MKKLFLTMLYCFCAIVTKAYYVIPNLTYTDDNGTTWTYEVHEDDLWSDTEGDYKTYYSTITAVDGYTTEVVVPNSFLYDPDETDEIASIEHPVKFMNNNLFANSSITSIQLPNKLERIPYQMFQNCIELVSLNVPNSVISIEPEAFFGCSSLTSINIPEGVTFIGNSAFSGCSSLTSVTIPAGVTSIEGNTFYECTNLTSVTIPTGVISIGINAFSYCINLTSVTIPTGVKSIEFSAFSDCSSLTSITIPEGVTSVGMNAFSNCTSLTSVNISEGIINIESGMFWNCTSLTSVTIPAGVKSIGSNAFSDCSSLTSIIIPEGVTSVGGYAFNNCLSLASITIPEGVTSIGDYTFHYCPKLTSITIPEGVESIGEHAFSACYILSSVSIPKTVKSIGSCAFEDCSSLATITIPEGVTSIEGKSFKGCSCLTSITIPEGVESIGDLAFYECTNLTSVTIPNGTKTIGSHAFNGCKSLISVTLPETITSIGEWAFVNCYCPIILQAETPPSIASMTFSDICVIVVPDKTAYEKYCADAKWNKLIQQLTYGEASSQSVTLVANEQVSALYTAIGEENLKLVYDLTINGTINGADIYIMRNKMTSLRILDLSKARIVNGGGNYYQDHTTQNDTLGANAFRELDLLQVKLPENLKSIEHQAFDMCYYLQQIEIPEGVTSIGDYTFNYCTALKDVKFPTTLKKIGSGAFSRCENLTKIILPIELETIESGAFCDCNHLKEVRFPSGLKYLGYSAFMRCYDITDVYSYTIEPVVMAEGTFDAEIVKKAILHYPLTSKYNYYTNGGWGEFFYMEEFNEPYEYFYLNNDYILNDDNGGVIDGTPDVDINAGGGLIVEDDLSGTTDEDTQHSDDMNIHHNGGHGENGVGGSIIANGNLHANKVHFNITVEGGKWHFFAFPFNIKKENIKCQDGADWVFHYYDGEVRATNGKGGWKKVTSEEGQGNFLKAGVGYIFQSSKNDVLVITVDEDDNLEEEGIRFNKDNKSNSLEAHASENEQDASWNFMGNPHLSYYDLDVTTYNAPITVWDGEKYIAVRPGDDEYQLAPFQAFFVQKPEGVKTIEFSGENQLTHQQKETKAQTTKAYARNRFDANRLIVNINLTNGVNTDKTRVVFNDAQKMNYEIACDAAKFTSTDVLQLYTLDNRKVKYAINERPQEEGCVPVGYSVPAYGNYCIDATRMDTPMMLKDLQTGMIHDFDEGSYTFVSEAGIFDNRFVLMTRAAATSIDVATLGSIKVAATEGGIEVSQLNGITLNVFAAGGEKVTSTQTDGVIPVTAGIYVVETNGKSVKVVVK